MSARSTRRRWMAGCGLVVALLLCWCGLLARGALAVRAAFDEFAAAAAEGTTDLNQVRSSLTGLRAELVSLRSLATPLLAVAPYLGWLPEIGPDVRAAPELIEAGVDLLDAGQVALDAVVPLWPLRSANGQSALATLAGGLIRAAPQLEGARQAVERAQARVASIDIGQLSAGVRGPVERAASALSLLQSGFDAVDVLPVLLGFDRPRTYLILLQNDDELRPSGGFISAAARVTFDRGEIIDLDVRDSYQVDDFLHKPYGFAPEPLQEFMGSQMWLFRDANWSPDYPTAARQAAELYTYGTGVSVDGVIAVNQQSVRDIVGALGPLQVEPDQLPVDASNLIAYMRSAWAPPPGETDVTRWAAARKDFIGRLMDAALNRVQAEPDRVDWLAVARAVGRSLESRDLLVWIDDAAASAIVAERRWDGAIRQVGGDYWMIVDSNVGFNKANAVVESSAAYTVTLLPDGTGDAELTIHTAHTGPAVEGCTHYLEYTLAVSYDALIQSCYWDYVRVLAPKGASMMAYDQHPVPADFLVTGRSFDGSIRVDSELGKTVFGTLFVLERGRAIDVRLAYRLPSAVEWAADGGRYALTMQKQPGAKPRATNVTLIWPEGFVLANSSATPLDVAAGLARFEFDGATDADLSVTWSRP